MGTQLSYHQAMMGWDGGGSWLFMGGYAVLWLAFLTLLVAVSVLMLRGQTQSTVNRRRGAKHKDVRSS